MGGGREALVAGDGFRGAPQEEAVYDCRAHELAIAVPRGPRLGCDQVGDPLMYGQDWYVGTRGDSLDDRVVGRDEVVPSPLDGVAQRWERHEGNGGGRLGPQPAHNPLQRVLVPPW